MNDDYDDHILLKYRVAVAIAIIKSTPENLTSKKYLELLKNHINPEMESYDPDMTICEDDFNFNDDDDCCNNDNDKPIDDLNANNETQLFDSQTNDSVTILKDFNFNDMIRNMNNDKELTENSSVSDVLRILRSVDNGERIETEVSCSHGNIQNHTQSTYYESSQSQNVEDLEFITISKAPQYENCCKINDNVNPKKTNVISIENPTFYESTQTFHEHTDSFTHVSQSQVDAIVLPRYLIQKKIPKFTNNHVEQNFNADICEAFENRNTSENKPNNGNTGRDINNTKKADEVNYNKKHKYGTQDNNNIDNSQAKRFRTVEHSINSNTDATYLNEIKSNFDMNASGNNSDIHLNANFKSGNDLFRNLFVKSDIDVNSSLNNLNDQSNTNINKVRRDSNNDNRYNLENFGSQTSVKSNNKANKIQYNSQTLSQFSQEFGSEPSVNNIEAVIEPTLIQIKQQTVTEAKEESGEEQIIEDLFDKLTDSQAEVVPFKVLEELNKVKSFLDKRNRRASSECVSDSGYKSDSQSRSSIKSAVLQSSNIWLNQSAHCLLTHVTSCPLVVSTEEITNEISKTLGRLIDRLHEDEKYPSFLEEHLQTVDRLLKEIYEHESADQLLQKDENIHRLFLLSKSCHITKYTMEKIIIILEDLLTTISNEEPLESSRTIQTENLSYIFHILETLIKKLVAFRNFSSQQSTQNSQEDEVILKRSSITDIWRRKWNPIKKSDLDCNTSAKQCVLIKCSDVLNRLIVQAMAGYSLISYFALQCFNLLQN